MTELLPTTHQDGNGVDPQSPGHLPAARALPERRPAVMRCRAMLEARSVALVGASPRPASFGRRMLEEVGKSGARPRIYPVNPRYAELDGRQCYPSLADLPAAPELVLLAVPDAALEQQLSLAAEIGSAGAVIFGNAHEDQPATAVPRRLVSRSTVRPGGRSARATGRDRPLGGNGAVRGRLHGLRQRQSRPARHRLHRARPAARRAGGAGHALRLGVLGAAADPRAASGSRWLSPPGRSS